MFISQKILNGGSVLLCSFFNLYSTFFIIQFTEILKNGRWKIHIIYFVDVNEYMRN